MNSEVIRKPRGRSEEKRLAERERARRVGVEAARRRHLLRSQSPAPDDGDLLVRHSLLVRLHGGVDDIQQLQAGLHFAKHAVLAIQLGLRRQRDEELEHKRHTHTHKDKGSVHGGSTT